jgi:hypothetical protein
MEGDPLERARLAEAEGAAGLVEALDDGGAITTIALAALPHTDDAEVALGRLAEIVLTADPTLRGAVIEAILAITGQPRRSRELLDPEGARKAGEAVLTLAKREDVPREQRALAISAARALAEKGYVEAARIPTDLDPR